MRDLNALESTEELVSSCSADECIYRRKRVIDGRDDEGVSDPDEASCCEGYRRTSDIQFRSIIQIHSLPTNVLRNRDVLSRAAHVLDSSGDQAPGGKIQVSLDES